MKALVANFSCSGVTRRLAQRIADVVKGELFEIVPTVPYTDADLDWTDVNSRSTVEMKDMRSRPSICGKVDNFDEYNVVFVGFPIWWYVAPTIINTFLESYDFSGKTVVPFATSGSSGVGKTDGFLRPSCSSATDWRPSKRLSANADSNAIKEWIANLNL